MNKGTYVSARLPRTKKQLATLAKARAARESSAPRKPPEGFDSIEEFFGTVKEIVGPCHLTRTLAKELGVDEKSVRRWCNGEKLPMQTTIDQINRGLNKILRQS